MFKEIDAHDVISFDLFDTLLERTIDAPNDLFDLMLPYSLKYCDPSKLNFKEARLKARNWVSIKSEEIDLDLRYRAIAEKYLLDKKHLLSIMEYELASELFILKTRYVGKELYKYALLKNKRIIIISDTFFDRKFIMRLLDKNNLNGFNNIYLSSEEGFLKRTSNLFERVLIKENTNPSNILHIGDDDISDCKMAAKKGISNIRIPKKDELVGLYSNLLNHFDSIGDLATRSIIKGLCSIKCTSKNIGNYRNKSFCDINIFAYTHLGPIFLSFAHWIVRQALEDGITDLYFLARDGDIAKKCVEIITANKDISFKTHYILASRRSTQVANLISDSCIQNSLELNFTPTSLGKLSNNRFGVSLEDVPSEVFLKYKFKKGTCIADWNLNSKNIKAFFSDSFISNKILENAKNERESLSSYYISNGLGNTDKKNIAFVDIGHGGTLQNEITKLMHISNSKGYYFATFERIRSVLDQNSHTSLGFLTNNLKANSRHFYKEFIIMYELIFINDKPSFIKMKKTINSLEAIFLEDLRNAKSINFAKLIHLGITEFITDINSHADFFNIKLDLSANDSVIAYNDFLRNPSLDDYKLFSGITFENAYSGRDICHIVPPLNQINKQQGLWKINKKFITSKSTETIFFKILMLFLNNENKYRKLINNPRAFILDSKNKFLKVLAVILRFR